MMRGVMRNRKGVPRAPLAPLLAALLLAASACGGREGAAPAAPGIKVAFASLNFDAALGRARAENRIVMVDVYTDWCGWCKKLDAETYADARVADALKDFIAIKVNAEKGGEAVAQRYGVDGFPTILFVSGSGQIVKKVEGYVGADEMLRIVQAVRRPA